MESLWPGFGNDAYSSVRCREKGSLDPFKDVFFPDKLEKKNTPLKQWAFTIMVKTVMKMFTIKSEVDEKKCEEGEGTCANEDVTILWSVLRSLCI